MLGRRVRWTGVGRADHLQKEVGEAARERERKVRKRNMYCQRDRTIVVIAPQKCLLVWMSAPWTSRGEVRRARERKLGAVSSHSPTSSPLGLINVTVYLSPLFCAPVNTHLSGRPGTVSCS